MSTTNEGEENRHNAIELGVPSATGPDGSLYIVDMYRGIIQEGNWVRPGSYLRGIVEKYELDKNIGRGRIFRIDHTGSKRPVRRPRLLDETPAELVVHLADPNGWWRSEAQKLLILHNDKSTLKGPNHDQTFFHISEVLVCKELKINFCFRPTEHIVLKSPLSAKFCQNFCEDT